MSETDFTGTKPQGTRAAALAFVNAAAAGRNAWWRYLLAVVVIVVITLTLQLVLIVAAGVLGVPVDDPAGGGTAPGSPTSVAGFAVIMLSIAAMLPATFLAVRVIHRRPIGTLFTGQPTFDWCGCGISAAVTLVTVALLALILAAARPGAVDFVFDPSAFFLFLPVVLTLVPLQVVAEEVFFRGYVLQAMAWLTGRWWLRLLVPAALFTLAHIANNEFRSGGLWAAADYSAIALYLGYLALRGGGLEHAIGFHVGLNTAFFSFAGLSIADFHTPTVVLIADYDFRLGLLGTVLICAIHYGLVIRRS